MFVTDFDPAALAADASRNHSQPILDEGPCDLCVVYAMPGTGFDVIVNGDHLLSWGIAVDALQEAAFRNLATWSATAAWTDEVSGERRLISSDTGDGWDASRIILPEVRDRLVAELGGSGRVLIGLPERHLLIAGTLRPGDDEFAGLFAEFVIESSGRGGRAGRSPGVRARRRSARRVRRPGRSGLTGRPWRRAPCPTFVSRPEPASPRSRSIDRMPSTR